MKRRFARTRVLIIALCLAVALSACAPATAPVDTEPSPEVTDTGPEYETAPTQHVTISNDQFTLRFDSGSSLNPITGDNADNLLVTELLFEGLFSLDSAFTPHPVLCESAVTEDNLVYTITLKPDIPMSDESTLTATDVAYTLNYARERGRFVNRLANIESVTASDELTIVITLKAPNAHLTKLLDVPIIKTGSIEYNLPPGTGPYVYSGGDAPYLTRLPGRSDFAELPVAAINLAECTGHELIGLFSDGLIDLVWDDPTDAVVFEANRQHDVRAYNTTTMLFLGFSTRIEALRIPDLRRAIGLAVDRQYITSEIMNGWALPSQLAVSPAYPGYLDSWEYSVGDVLLEISKVISSVGLTDDNNDSYLEFPVPGLGYEPFSIDFIVYAGNAFKTSTAAHIAEALGRVGFDIRIRELKWDEYNAALESGDFDMYLGEVTLGADFDLSPLLLPDGRLNYGGTGDELYMPYLEAYFTAGSQTAELIAVRQLCERVYTIAPFIPISYKKNLLHSYRGIISGAAPSQSSGFFNLTGWTIVTGTGNES